jgi:hypothetical protein
MEIGEKESGWTFLEDYVIPYLAFLRETTSKVEEVSSLSSALTN